MSAAAESGPPLRGGKSDTECRTTLSPSAAGGLRRGKIAQLCVLCSLSFCLLAGCLDSPTDSSLRNLHDADPATRRQAARALGEARDNRPGSEAVPALAESLKDADPDVRRLAAYALGRIGREAQPALPALRDMLADDHEPNRLAAAYAINAIAPRDASPVAILSRAAGRGEPRAIIALGRIGPGAVDAVPALTRALRSPVPLVRVKAAEALGRIGPGAEGAVPGLRRAVNDPDEDVRAVAVEAIKSIERGP